MIQHTVVFRLKHARNSIAEKQFLEKAQALSKLPKVVEFRVLSQVGKKNNFDFGLSMYFMSDEAYQSYNNHPEHVHFVNNVWLPEVDEFLEIDYVELC